MGETSFVGKTDFLSLKKGDLFRNEEEALISLTPAEARLVLESQRSTALNDPSNFGENVPLSVLALSDPGSGWRELASVPPSDTKTLMAG